MSTWPAGFTWAACRAVPEYLTIGDAARITGWSIKTLRRWADEGKVRAERSPGGHRLINRDDVSALPKKSEPS